MPTLFMRMEDGQPASDPLSVESLFYNISWKRNMTYAEKRAFAARAGVYPVLNNRPTSKPPFGRRYVTTGYRWNPNSEVFTRVWTLVPLPLERVRHDVMGRITKMRHAEAYAHVSYGGSLYQVDLQSIQCILGAIAEGQTIGLPPGFTWRDSDNVDHLMSLTDLEQLGNAAFVQVNAAYKRGHRRKDAARSAVNVQDLADAMELS